MWGVRRHPVDLDLNEGEMKSADRLDHRGFTPHVTMASALRHVTIMKRRIVLKMILILAGTLILTQCRPPTPVAAAVEFAPGVGADADQPVIKELVAAFNEAEAAVKKADLDALMKFYATTYNYHGLKRSDVRRVWEEVFLHYRGHQFIPCLHRAEIGPGRRRQKSVCDLHRRALRDGETDREAHHH